MREKPVTTGLSTTCGDVEYMCPSLCIQVMHAVINWHGSAAGVSWLEVNDVSIPSAVNTGSFQIISGTSMHFPKEPPSGLHTMRSKFSQLQCPIVHQNMQRLQRSTQSCNLWQI